MKFRIKFIMFAIVLLIMPLFLMAGEEIILFRELGAEKSRANALHEISFFNEFDAVERFKEVELDFGIITGHNINIDDRLKINLFDNKVYEAYIDRHKEKVTGTIAIRARFKEYEYGYMIISSTDGLSLATIEIPEKNMHYMISWDPNTKIHYLMELDNKDLDILEGEHISPPEELVAREIEEIERIAAIAQYGDDDSKSQTTIDFMIVYTPAARNWANNNGGINNIISQAMQRAQITMDNSQTYIDCNLVHAAEISYTESGSCVTDLQRLTGVNNGYMDQVHTWRNQYGADLVALFAVINDAGGVGWQLTTTSGRPDWAFSITRIHQAATSYTHIHEAGHNMGAHHHREANFQPGPGLYSYSAGWRWVNSQGRFCDVMTYGSGQYYSDGMHHTNVAVFSNPGVSHDGAATGHATFGDNARGLRNIRNVIAAYRTGQTASEPAVINSPSPGSTLTSSSVTFTRSTATGANAYWLYAGSSAGGHDMHSGEMSSISQTVSGITINGSPLYVRLWTRFGETWQYRDYTYQTQAQTSNPAVINSPSPGSTLTSSSVTFTRSTATGANAYWLFVGTSSGGQNIHSGVMSSISQTINGITINGSPVYVRLWTRFGETWQYRDYTYQTQNTSPAVINSPTPGSTLSSSSITFTRSTAAGANAYWLYVGTSAGGQNIHSGAMSSTSLNVSGIPTNGSTVYVRLWTRFGETWHHRDYTYQTSSGGSAVLINPVPGSVLSSSTITFTRSTASGANAYWLYVGTSPGSYNIFGGAMSSVSRVVSGIPTNGSTVYVRLWTRFGSTWYHRDYAFQTN